MNSGLMFLTSGSADIGDVHGRDADALPAARRRLPARLSRKATTVRPRMPSEAGSSALLKPPP